MEVKLQEKLFSVILDAYKKGKFSDHEMLEIMRLWKAFFEKEEE